MKIIKLNKQNEPEFDELSTMISDLEDFFNEDVDLDDKNWNKNLNAIIDFQDSDGGFKLLTSGRIPSDARVDFCYIPTYLCTATLMKTYLTDSKAFTSKQISSLLKGLKKSCARNLRGHGYEGLKGQINALNIFMNAGLREFLDLFPDFCPEFSEMIKKIVAMFQDMENQEKFTGPWGENYENEIKAINGYFTQRRVFVYGTLMNNESNHHYLQDATCFGQAIIKGYDMYDVGYYPAIIPGDNLIIGELYQVSVKDLKSIDILEGEGNLYIKKCETITDAEGKTTFAFVYVYNGDVSNLKKIPAWNREYVWYVSYGSNMLKERFLCYIKGGSYENSTYRSACDDISLPLAIKPIEIPYNMYFGNYSGSWENGGVSFLDTAQKGKSLGVAYLITKEQFEHIASQENGGRYPGGGEWYEDIINLGMMDGFEVKTITNHSLRDYNDPCSKYLEVLVRGIKENWQDISDEDIIDYLNNCKR